MAQGKQHCFKRFQQAHRIFRRKSFGYFKGIETHVFLSFHRFLSFLSETWELPSTKKPIIKEKHAHAPLRETCFSLYLYKIYIYLLSHPNYLFFQRARNAHNVSDADGD